MAAVVGEHHEQPARRMRMFPFSSSVSLEKARSLQLQGISNAAPPASSLSTSLPNNTPYPIYAKISRDGVEQFHKLQIKYTSRVRHVRRYLAKKYRVHLRQIELITQGGRVLLDNQLCSSVGIIPNSYIHVTITGDSEDDDDKLTVLKDAQSFISMKLRKVTDKTQITLKINDTNSSGVTTEFNLRTPIHFTGETLRQYLATHLNREFASLFLRQRDGAYIAAKKQLGDYLSDGSVIELTTEPPSEEEMQ